MKALTIIGFIPFLGVLMTFGGMFYIIALVIIALILINVFRIKKLIHEEISNSRRERAHASQALDGCRIWEKNERRDTFFLSCFMIPFILATTLIPEYRFVASFYLVGCYANLCDPFFRACSDLPKGKTMFQRFREWLRIPSESTATQ